MGMTERLEKMLAAGRDDAMLRFGLGSAYYNDGELAAAIPHLQACIVQDENYTAAYKLLGKALFQSDRLDEATDVLEDGLEKALASGDKQTEKEVRVFLNKIARQAADD
jgi:tetratricopeptide (TPR) repeat protein